MRLPVNSAYQKVRSLSFEQVYSYSSFVDIYKPSILIPPGEKLASLAQICPKGALQSPTHGHKYGEQWAPCNDYTNCWVHVGSHNRCKTYRDLHGGELPSSGQDKEVEKPFARHTMCIAEHNENHKISHTIRQHDLNERLLEETSYLPDHEVSHLRVDDYLANSYMAYWVSFKREIDLTKLLAPLGDFGKFLGGMLPKIQMTFQEYIKISLSGPPEFILRFGVSLTFNCQPLADIGNAIKAADFTTDKKIYNAIWPDAVTQICSKQPSNSIGAKLSIGFKGEQSISLVSCFENSSHSSVYRIV